jgi:hypothetical protein
MFDAIFGNGSRILIAVLAGLTALGFSPRQTLIHAAQERVRVSPVPDGGIVPDAEVDDQGVIHLVYVSSGDVFYVNSSDEGQSFTKPIRVNTEAGFAYGGAFRGPDLAVGKDATIHVVWYNAAYQQKRPKDEWGVMYSRLSPGAGTFEPTRNLNHTPSDNYSLAADQKGNVAVVWMAERVYASVSHNGGDSFSAPQDLKTDPCECCGSRAAYADDDSLAVLYRDKANNDRDTYLAILRPGARQFTHTKVSQTVWYIESCPMTGSFLSTTPGGLVAGWETKGQIYFARLNRRGQLLSAGEIHAAERGRYPVVLTAPDGITLVAWKNDTTLQWQLFDANDQRQGQGGTATSNTGDRPAGVVTKDGTFLLFP